MAIPDPAEQAPLFLFRCSTCGEYPVSELMARAFLTHALRRRLDEALHTGAAGAELTFLNGCCPRCSPDLDAHIELAALWPRLN